MEDAERFRLLGTYTTPRFRFGQRVQCQVRGEMVITGMTDAPIPWPLARRGRERPSLVVYKDLAKAIRRESNQAVAFWWGINPQTVSKWRRLLGVERATAGTSRLHSDYTKEPWAIDAFAKAHSKNRDPERCRKISEYHRGKPKPKHVLEAMRKGWRERGHTEESRRKISEALRGRGTLVPGTIPWTPEEDELVRTLPALAAACRTGRSLSAVYTRRGRLQVPDGRRRRWKREGQAVTGAA